MTQTPESATFSKVTQYQAQSDLVPVPHDVFAIFASKQSLISFMMLRGAGADRLSRIVDMAPISAATTAVNSLLLATVMWPYVSQIRLMVWLGSVAFVGALMVHAFFASRGKTYSRISPRAVRASLFSTLMIAAPWVILIFGILPHVPPYEQMMSYIVIAGTAAGGGLVLARSPLSANLYMITLIGSVAILNAFFVVTPSYLAVAFAIIFMVCMVIFTLQLSLVMLVNDRTSARLVVQMADLDAANHNIERMSAIDPVTDLENRRAFQEALDSKLHDVETSKLKSLTLYLLDLDHFKSVNDALGHQAGDLYLRETGRRIRMATGDKARLFRIGGDEFAILLDNMPNNLDVVWLGQRLISELSRPVSINGHVLQGGASIGVAQAPKHSVNPSELLTQADDALLEAKESGRGVVALFDTARKDHIKQQAIEAEKLMLGIGQGQIIMVYQPQINLSSTRLIGFEALVRWQHPEKGLLSPDKFMPLAEDKGLMLELCDAIMQRVHRDLKQWLAEGIDPGRIAINIHPLQLKHPDRFQRQLEAIAADCDTPSRIVVEITEDCIVGRGTESVPKIMQRLIDRGFKVSLDDFGTGFASLSHIKDLPITEIKIDRSFTKDMLKCDKSLAIVKAIYDMARPRNIEVVAEGVELEEQAKTLEMLGGHIAQGYYYSRPMSFVDATVALQTKRWETIPIEQDMRELKPTFQKRRTKSASYSVM